MGTGTAIWALDIAAKSPSTYRIDGFDISADQYPLASTLPKNVHLHIADAKKPFAEEFIGQFDAVHLRLLVCALERDDWQVVAANVLSLLKPGGAIQWEEMNGAATECFRGNSPIGIKNMAVVRRLFVNGAGHRLRSGWNMLGDIFLGMGMEDVDVDVVPIDRVPETRKTGTLTILRVCLGFVKLMIGSGKLDSVTKEEFAEMERKAYAEVEAGGYYWCKMYVSMGFKA